LGEGGGKGGRAEARTWAASGYLVWSGMAPMAEGNAGRMLIKQSGDRRMDFTDVLPFRFFPKDKELANDEWESVMSE